MGDIAGETERLWMLFVPFKSAPAQNALPFPVKMPTRRLGSSSIHSHTACRSAWPCVLMQFRERGRLSVTRRMCGVGKEMRVSWGFGGGVVKLDILGCLLLFILGLERMEWSGYGRCLCRSVNGL